MNSDIRDRLRRLGVHKGTRDLKPSPAKILEKQRLSEKSWDTEDPFVETLASERQALSICPTPFGNAAFRRARFSLDWVHGDRALHDVLKFSSEVIAQLIHKKTDPFDVRDAVFVDTETTGLAGGAGTLAFIVGVGYFETNGFVVDQFFLRDPSEEPAMLHAIEQRANSKTNVVTFNGQTFDLPLIETRFVLSRMPPPFGDKPHLDLLKPARRAWRGMIGDCSLGSLEYHLLGVRRTQQDIAGFLIPQLYRDYLQTGSHELTPEMSRVLYHNLHDILSMVTLTTRLAQAQQHPSHPSEHIAIGRQHERDNDWQQAEQVYEKALDRAEKPFLEKSGLSIQSQVRTRLAHAIKKQRKHEDAIAHWVVLADEGDTKAMLELAKHYEWRNVDLELALHHARAALIHCTDRKQRADIDKRVRRIEDKRARGLDE